MGRTKSLPPESRKKNKPLREVYDPSFYTSHQGNRSFLHLTERPVSRFTKLRPKTLSFFKLDFHKHKNERAVVNRIADVKLLGPHRSTKRGILGSNEYIWLLIKDAELKPKPKNENLETFYRELLFDQLVRAIQVCKNPKELEKWCRKGSFSIDIDRRLKLMILTEVFNNSRIKGHRNSST